MDYDVDFDPALPEVPLEAQDPFLDDLVAQSDGSWLAGYARLHSKILSAQVPVSRQRFAVWTCSPLEDKVPIQEDSTRLCAGFANRIMGLTAAFLYAVLTERAFIVEWPPPAAEHLGRFFYSPYLDWKGSVSLLASLVGESDTLRLDTRLGRSAVREELASFDWRLDHQQRVVRLTLLEARDFRQSACLSPCLHVLSLDPADMC